MKKMGWIGVGAIALLLAGCSAPTGEITTTTIPSAEQPSEAPSSDPTPAAIEMTDAPVIDATTPWGEAGFESANAWYLASVTSVWQGEASTEDALLGAGALACEQIVAGSALDAIVVVSGDSPDAVLNNSRVVNYAQMALCP